MSSVNNDDARTQEYNSLREEYETREARMKKRHNDQMNQITQSHAQTIRELEAQHAKDIQAYRMNSRETLTDTEQKYQQQINDIQETNRKRTMQDAENNYREMKQLKDGTRADAKKTKEIHNSQMNTLRNNYENELVEQTNQYADNFENVKEMQKETIDRNKENLTKAYDGKLEHLKEITDEKIGDLTQDLKNTRTTKDNEITTLKSKMLQQKQNLENAKVQAVTHERKVNQNFFDSYKENNTKNMDDLKQKYADAMKSQDASFQSELGNFRNQSQSNFDNEMGSMRREYHDLKADTDIDRFNYQTTAKRERDNLLNAHKNELDLAENARSQILEEANKKSEHEVKGLRKENDLLLNNQRRFYQEQKEIAQSNYADGIENQVMSLKEKNQLDQSNNDMRNRKLKNMFDNERSQNEEFFKDIIDQKEDLHKDMMAEQRTRMTQEKKISDESWRNKIRAIEIDHQQKSQLRDEAYQKQIQDLMDKHKSELRSIEKKYQTRIGELDKSTKFEIESQKQQHDIRETQMREEHARQIEQIRQAYASHQIRNAKG